MSADATAYRDAEAVFWSSFGCSPSAEHHARLPTTGTTVRVQEVGEGPPVLFLHGGPNAGSTWAPLVTHLVGLRCLLVDRPGTGLSAPYPIAASNLPRIGPGSSRTCSMGSASVVPTSWPPRSAGTWRCGRRPPTPTGSCAWSRWERPR
jgi:pimeloyl-ACP methyl ester carboxylesterase